MTVVAFTPRQQARWDAEMALLDASGNVLEWSGFLEQATDDAWRRLDDVMRQIKHHVYEVAAGRPSTADVGALWKMESVIRAEIMAGLKCRRAAARCYAAIDRKRQQQLRGAR